MHAISTATYGLVSGVDLGSRVSVAVARKSLDVAESRGDAAVDMIRTAVDSGRRALRITARGVERGAISARPGPGEAGQRLDVTG